MKTEDLIQCKKCGLRNRPRKTCIKCGSPLIPEAEPPKTGEPESIICPECKSKNNIDAIFCSGCGTKLKISDETPEEPETKSVICPECKSQNAQNAKFCIGCGKKLDISDETEEDKPENPKTESIICPECGYENNAEAKFCIGCGRKLGVPDKITEKKPVEDKPEAEKPKTKPPEKPKPKPKPKKTINLPKINHENYPEHDLYKLIGLEYQDNSYRVVEGPSQKEIDTALKKLRVLTAKTEHFQTFSTINDILRLPANRKLYNIERFIHKMYPQCKHLNITSVKKLATSLVESEDNYLPTKTQIKEKIEKNYWKEDVFLERTCEDKKKKHKRRKPKKTGEKKKSGCFIATAAYGTGMEVDILRKWRDESLLPHRTGEILVECYYMVGRPLSKIIEKSEILKYLTRLLLKPVIKGVKFSMNRGKKDV